MGDKSSKLRIAVLFGGRSAEHDLSVLSTTNVMVTHGLARAGQAARNLVG